MANTGTVWAFDLGKGSIGDPLRRRNSAARAVRLNDKFLHKASQLIKSKEKGAAKAPVQELRLMASLLSSRQFGILATAGFDLGAMENLFN